MILLSENQRHHLIATYVLMEKFTCLMLMFLGLDANQLPHFRVIGSLAFYMMEGLKFLYLSHLILQCNTKLLQLSDSQKCMSAPTKSK